MTSFVQPLRQWIISFGEFCLFLFVCCDLCESICISSVLSEWWAIISRTVSPFVSRQNDPFFPKGGIQYQPPPHPVAITIHPSLQLPRKIYQPQQLNMTLPQNLTRFTSAPLINQYPYPAKSQRHEPSSRAPLLSSSSLSLSGNSSLLYPVNQSTCHLPPPLLPQPKNPQKGKLPITLP